MKQRFWLLLSAGLLIAAAFIACKKASSGTGTTTTSISALNCAAATFSATATSNVSYSGTATVPYTGGNGGAYTAGTAISSTGVTGLTATLVAGTLASGAGNITYTITGTPTAAGTASFAITLGGQSCTLSLTINSAATTSCSSQTGFAKLLCLCDAFKATLSTSQIATLQLPYTFSNIKTWSNLPAAMSSRLGLKLGDLNSTQLTAAKAVIEAMSGTTNNEGYDEVKKLWLADDYLSANGGGSTYGSGNYYIAFFGTPATTGQFEIMMTGHHKTVANTYNNGALISGTPHFVATEPITWTSGSTTYAPVSQERDAFAAILASLTSTQLTSALSSSTFSDILLGPNANWSFPTTFSGYQCNGMTTAQKALVMNAIKTYVNDIDDASAATITALYESELDNTYILYKGSTTMTTQNDYFRIAGPHVWIEFHNPNGVILSGIHIHSVWRDRVNDYGTTR